MRPSADRPYSNERTAAGHLRSKALHSCSTSSSWPVSSKFDRSAIVVNDCSVNGCSRERTTIVALSPKNLIVTGTYKNFPTFCALRPAF